MKLIKYFLFLLPIMVSAQGIPTSVDLIKPHALANTNLSSIFIQDPDTVQPAMTLIVFDHTGYEQYFDVKTVESYVMSSKGDTACYIQNLIPTQHFTEEIIPIILIISDGDGITEAQYQYSIEVNFAFTGGEELPPLDPNDFKTPNPAPSGYKFRISAIEKYPHNTVRVFDAQKRMVREFKDYKNDGYLPDGTGIYYIHVMIPGFEKPIIRKISLVRT